MDLIHDAADDGDSVILRAKCIKPGIPNKDRTYAVKVLTNYFVESTQTKVRIQLTKVISRALSPLDPSGP